MLVSKPTLYSFFCAISPDDVEGLDLLRWEDQQMIRKYAEGGGPQTTAAPAATESGIEVSQTSRATCRHCNQKIMKGEVGYLLVACVTNLYSGSEAYSVDLD